MNKNDKREYSLKMDEQATRSLFVTRKTKIEKIHNDQSELIKSLTEQLAALQSQLNALQQRSSTVESSGKEKKEAQQLKEEQRNPRELFEDPHYEYYWDDFVCEVDDPDSPIVIESDDSNLWSDLVYKLACVFAKIGNNKMVLKRRNNSNDPRAYPKYEILPLSKFPAGLGYKRWDVVRKEKKIVKRHLYKKNKLDCPVNIYWYSLYYSEVAFEPGIKLHNEFNLFRGFRAREVKTVEESKFNLILKHIWDVLADSNEEHYNYIMDWLAFRVQKPGEKNGKTLLFQSVQGAGKNILFEWFGESVIGMDHYRIINNIKLLTGKFNSVIEGCLFMIGDEISITGKDGAKIENILAQSVVMIRHKYMEPYKSPNLFQMVLFTNNDNYFNLEAKQRRFDCFRASPIHRDDSEYFRRLKAQMNNDDCADHFYTWLLRRDISGFNDKSISSHVHSHKDYI